MVKNLVIKLGQFLILSQLLFSCMQASGPSTNKSSNNVNNNIAPTITTQPSSQSLSAGGNISFSVTAAGTAPFTYQWILGNMAIPGATSATYNISNVQITHAGSYTVKVTNSVGTVTSSAATLSVQVSPLITTQPSSQSLTAGGNTSFSVSATGTAPFTYQWMLGSTAITGATSATYTISNVQNSHAGSYTVKVTNSVGTVTSSAATLTVNAAAVAPTITTQPTSQSLTAGGNASFSVSATGTAPFTYQWMLGTTAITGATSATYTISNVQNAQAGSYFVKVTNSAGTVTSSAATLTVNAAAVAPTITTQPTAQSLTVGGNASFSVSATGTAPFTYQWMLGTTPITGATSATYTISNVQSTHAGSYTVKVTNSVSTVTSSAATLTVNTVAVSPSGCAIAALPAGSTMSATIDSKTLTVNCSQISGLSYIWYNNLSQITGATSSSFQLSNMVAGSYSYTVRVSNNAGSIISQAFPITVTVTTGNDPCKGTSPAPGTVCTGGAIYVGTLSPGATSGTGTDRYMTTPGGCGEIPATQQMRGNYGYGTDYPTDFFTPTCAGTDIITKSWNNGFDNYTSSANVPGLTDYSYNSYGPNTDSRGIGKGAINKDINYGSTNTTNIAAVTAAVNGGYHAAALYCNKLNLGGYKDWYLPNRYELNLIYINKAKIPGLDTIVYYDYWSSTESPNGFAWIQSFSDGYQNTAQKGMGWRVRCVRRF